jgi:hypothetical protein
MVLDSNRTTAGPQCSPVWVSNRNNSLDGDEAVCVDVGTATSYVSMALWFMVLLPQVIRNQHRRSVQGLNPLWALANFTASLCNAFFVFTRTMPIAIRISGVYMPIIEGLMLMQFYCFNGGNDHRDGVRRINEPPADVQPQERIATQPAAPTASHLQGSSKETEGLLHSRDATGAAPQHVNSESVHCISSFTTEGIRSQPSYSYTSLRLITCLLILLWLLIVALEVGWIPIASSDPPADLMWISILLWSVETFPQLFTNISAPHQAVQGQAVISVLITCVGKSTDSLTAYLLDMPVQNKLLGWFSGSSAWINALHVLVMYSHRANDVDVTDPTQRQNQVLDGSSTEEHEPCGDESQDKAHGGSWGARCCCRLSSLNSMLPSIEQRIRRAYKASSCLRMVTGLILSACITATLVGASMTLGYSRSALGSAPAVHAAFDIPIAGWFFMLPMTTLLIVSSFHLWVMRHRLLQKQKG